MNLPIVTFDFDLTLCIYDPDQWDSNKFERGINYVPNLQIIDEMMKYVDTHDIYIVTARAYADENKGDRVPVEWFINEYELPVQAAYFTDGLKADTLIKIGSNIHYDDKVEEFEKLANECQLRNLKTPEMFLVQVDGYNV